MNKTEIIFFTAVIIILLALISQMPEYHFIFLFLLALAILFIIMSILAKYKKRFENPKLSLISYIVGIILFIIYFANTMYSDITQNMQFISSNTTILTLFILTMLIGWYFEKNKD